MRPESENLQTAAGQQVFEEEQTEEQILDEKLHMHMHENGIAHSHGTGHRHVHSAAEKKAVVNRLSKAIGHLEENDQDAIIKLNEAIDKFV